MRTGLLADLMAGVIASTLSMGCQPEPQIKAAVESIGQQGSAGSSGQVSTNTTEADSDKGDDEAALVGDWKGQSVVQVKNSPAKDETVVWHISKGRQAGNLLVRADKIVNGKAISMGALEFTYDKAQKLLVCKYEQGVWSLHVKGKSMEGTLTRPDQTVFRKVTLEKAG